MKTLKFKQILLSFSILFLSFGLFAQKQLITTDTHIRFFSTTPAEDIESNNYASTGTLNIETGDVAFSVPMQSFEFEKSLMQRHFNQKRFLNTSEFPIAQLVGKVEDFGKVDLSQNGTYNVIVSGEMTIKGETNSFREPGTIKVSNGQIVANSKFFITLAEYGVTFSGGKPASNIADKVEVTVVAEYER
ncbi:MAG: YceI family protein [Bacteroidales bacterium]|nr:YceI family protein [Bacteroidales bacterium]